MPSLPQAFLLATFPHIKHHSESKYCHRLKHHFPPVLGGVELLLFTLFNNKMVFYDNNLPTRQPSETEVSLILLLVSDVNGPSYFLLHSVKRVPAHREESLINFFVTRHPTIWQLEHAIYLLTILWVSSWVDSCPKVSWVILLLLGLA